MIIQIILVIIPGENSNPNEFVRPHAISLHVRKRGVEEDRTRCARTWRIGETDERGERYSMVRNGRRHATQLQISPRSNFGPRLCNQLLDRILDVAARNEYGQRIVLFSRCEENEIREYFPVTDAYCNFYNPKPAPRFNWIDITNITALRNI